MLPKNKMTSKSSLLSNTIFEYKVVYQTNRRGRIPLRVIRDPLKKSTYMYNVIGFTIVEIL